MRALMLLTLIGCGAWLLYTRVIAPPPPPPPPPPVIAEPPKPLLSEEEMERVFAATKDSDPSVRWEAVKFLARAGNPEADTVLYQMLVRDSEPALRRNVAVLFADRPGPKTVLRLSGALRDGSPEVRIAVLQSLAKIGDLSAASAVASALQDTDEQVRLQALASLNELQRRKEEQARAEQMRQEELRKQQEQKR